MKYRLYAILLVLLALIGYLQFSGRSSLEDQFEKWKTDYSRVYQASEQFYRFKIFQSTYREIQEHNARADAGLQTFTLALNGFSDLSDEEFKNNYLAENIQSQPNFECSTTQPPPENLPADWDWAAKSAVNAVRDLKKCSGSGYAIATAESLQANYYITLHQKLTMSAQQIIDCTKDQGNQGCKSGSPVNSFTYLKTAGIASEQKYPFQGTQQTCQYTSAMKAWELLNCVKVTPDSEKSIKAAAYVNPLVASINAQTSKMKSYSTGIFSATLTSPCKTKPNHYMLLVGYGSDGKNKNYWKLKNSWGSSWGQQGYLYIIRKGDGEGDCGVQHDLYYPQ